MLSVQCYMPEVYGERELSFLTTVASQVALGVQNARLFEERERQIHRAGRAGADWARHKLDSRAAADGLRPQRGAARGLAAESVSLTVFNRDRSLERRLVASGTRLLVDERGELSPSQSDETLAGWIVRHGRPLRLNDLTEVHPPFADAHLLSDSAETPARSYLGIPVLAYDGTPIGALGVTNRRPSAYGVRDETFLVGVGSQMSLGVQNARLFAEAQGSASALQSKVGELLMLLQAAQVLSSSLKPREVLDALMEMVGRQLKVSTVALWTVGEDSCWCRRPWPASQPSLQPRCACRSGAASPGAWRRARRWWWPMSRPRAARSTRRSTAPTSTRRSWASRWSTRSRRSACSA